MKQRAFSIGCVILLLLQLALPAFAAMTTARGIAQAFIDRIRETSFSGTVQAPVIFYELTGDDVPELILIARDGQYANKFQIFTYSGGTTRRLLELVCGFASDPYDALYAMKDGSVGIYSTNSGGGGGEPQYNVHDGTTYTFGAGGTYVVESSFRYEYYRNPDGSTSLISATVDGTAVTEAAVIRAEEAFAANRAALLADSQWDKPSAFGMSRDAALAYLNRINGQFFDVLSGTFYTDAVDWAVEQGVTKGTSTYRFSPDATCSRGQVVTFLWRAVGSPSPQTGVSPFADVTQPNAYYYQAVLWALENGITSGVTPTRFAPVAPCTRAQVVTFLWRTVGKPEPAAGSNPFSDVKPDAYYYKAVLWAVRKGITAGTSATAFRPDAACTRGQIVTFLYRAKDVEVSPPQAGGWSETYADFVLNNRFLYAGQSYSNDAGFFTAALYDMDRDGTPELILSNGGVARTDRWAYLYTYAGGSVTYLAIGPAEAYYDPNNRTGIYGRFSTLDGETWTKYTKTGNSVVTSGAGSFPSFSGHTDFVSLPTRTTSQIRSSGWAAFVATQPLP